MFEIVSECVLKKLYGVYFEYSTYLITGNALSEWENEHHFLKNAQKSMSKLLRDSDIISSFNLDIMRAEVFCISNEIFFKVLCELFEQIRVNYTKGRWETYVTPRPITYSIGTVSELCTVTETFAKLNNSQLTQQSFHKLQYTYRLADLVQDPLWARLILYTVSTEYLTLRIGSLCSSLCTAHSA